MNILRIFRQFELFQQYQLRLSAQVGQAQAKRLVNDALVLITLGGNDFVNNYFLTPFSARSRQFSIPDYCRYLISEYRKILRVILINKNSFTSQNPSKLAYSVLLVKLLMVSKVFNYLNIVNLIL